MGSSNNRRAVEMSWAASVDADGRVADRVRVLISERLSLTVTVRAPRPGQTRAALEAELQLWAQALADWRAQRFHACRDKLQALRALDADRFLYQLCDRRVASMIDAPPTSPWDATTVIGH